MPSCLGTPESLVPCPRVDILFGRLELGVRVLALVGALALGALVLALLLALLGLALAILVVALALVGTPLGLFRDAM
eukprot:9343211-Alexandrium_andersonii.AAC.1